MFATPFDLLSNPPQRGRGPKPLFSGGGQEGVLDDKGTA